MSQQVITLEFSPEFRALQEKLKDAPVALTAAIKRGMDQATPQVVGKIQEERLTGKGPFPVEQHRLGQRSGDLRQSVYGTTALIEGGQVTSRIGSPLAYASVHEFGFNGQVWVQSFSRTNPARVEQVSRVSKKTGKAYKTKVKVPTGTTQVRAHSRWLSLPARAPFGYGAADHLTIFTRCIERQAVTLFTGGTHE